MHQFAVEEQFGLGFGGHVEKCALAVAFDVVAYATGRFSLLRPRRPASGDGPDVTKRFWVRLGRTPNPNPHEPILVETDPWQRATRFVTPDGVRRRLCLARTPRRAEPAPLPNPYPGPRSHAPSLHGSRLGAIASSTRPSHFFATLLDESKRSPTPTLAVYDTAHSSARGDSSTDGAAALTCGAGGVCGGTRGRTDVADRLVPSPSSLNHIPCISPRPRRRRLGVAATC